MIAKTELHFAQHLQSNKVIVRTEVRCYTVCIVAHHQIITTFISLKCGVVTIEAINVTLTSGSYSTYCTLLMKLTSIFICKSLEQLKNFKMGRST